jgi:cytochrome bd ubiquinol oxidase subunit II
MTDSALHYSAFALFLFFLLMYTVLDGFDLGIGLFAPWLRDRTLTGRLLGFITPFWDGNEVWLVIGVGFLFAAFPTVFSLLLPAYYLPLMLVLIALIARAVALDFSYHPGTRIGMWQRIASIGSAVALLGCSWLIAQIVTGIPLVTGDDGVAVDMRKLDYFSPITLIFAVAALPIFAWHGALFARTREPDNRGLKDLAGKLWYGAIAGGVIIALLIFMKLTNGCHSSAIAFMAATIAGLITGRALLNRPFLAFTVSCLTIAAGWMTIAALMFPYLLPPASGEDGLLIGQAAAPVSSLIPLMAVTVSALPIILWYTRYVYRVFSNRKKEVA